MLPQWGGAADSRAWAQGCRWAPPSAQDGPSKATCWTGGTTLLRLESPGLNSISNTQVPDESRIPFSAHTSALCQVPQNELGPSKLRNRTVIPEVDSKRKFKQTEQPPEHGPQAGISFIRASWEFMSLCPSDKRPRWLLVFPAAEMNWHCCVCALDLPCSCPETAQSCPHFFLSL